MWQLLAVTGVALALQLVVCGWHSSSIRRLIVRPSQSAFNDWLFLLFTITGLRALMLIAFSVGSSILLGRASAWISASSEDWRIPLDTGFVVLDAAVYYLLFSLADYWNHRLWHTEAGWLLHRMHHSGTDYTPLLTQRNHPLQLALEPLVRIWPLVFFDVSPPVIAAVLVLDAFYQSVVHADLPWSWGWFGRWLWLSPQGHKIHHSSLPEHANKNLGIFAFWDRLFGTWYDGQVPANEVGITDKVHNQSPIWREMVADSVAFTKAVATWLAVRKTSQPNNGHPLV